MPWMAPKKSKKEILCLGISVFLFLGPSMGVKAATLLTDWYLGARATGMGNAVTAVPEGIEGVYYNPALLAASDSVKFSLINPSVYINHGALKYALGDITFKKNTASTADLQADLSKLYDYPLRGGMNVLPSIQFGPLMIGAIAMNRTEAFVVNQAFPRITAESYFDYGVSIGYGHEWKNTYKHKYRFGLLGKNFWRRGVSFRDISLGEFLDIATGATVDSNFFKQYEHTEHAFSMDAGFTYEYQITKRRRTQHGPWPTGGSSLNFGATWQNIGDTSFGSPKVPGNFPTIEEQVNVGAAFRFGSPLFDFTASAEMRHITQDFPYLRQKLHGGIEMAIPFNRFRAGVMNGKLSLGYTFDFLFLKATASTWVQDFAPQPGLLEDRFYMVEVNLLNLDLAL